jgi:hypothetical protein
MIGLPSATSHGGIEGLDAIPTDEELSKTYGYTPVTSGWINTAAGAYYPAPYIPMGWNAAGAYGPRMALGAPLPVPETLTAEYQAKLLKAHQDRMYLLALLGGAIGAVAAITTIALNIRSLKRK